MPVISVRFSVPRLLDELRHGHSLQFGDVDIALLDLFVAVVGVVAAAVGLFGQLFGQAQRFAVDRPAIVVVGRPSLRLACARASDFRHGSDYSPDGK